MAGKGGLEDYIAVQTAKEPSKPLLKGLSLDKVISDIGKELKDMANHGAHEVGSLLNTGSAFVMYPRGENGVEDPQQGLPQGPEMEQGGREM
jgi:hypothetical protein